MECPLHSRRPRHIEVSVQPALASSLSLLERKWREFLDSRTEDLNLGNDGEVDLTVAPPDLQNATIQAIVTDDSDTSQDHRSVLYRDDLFIVYAFVLSNEEAYTEELQPTACGDDEWTAGCDNLTIPHSSLHGSWESLIFDSSIKRQLLDYAQSALLFSDKKVSSHLVQWNRMILLHGNAGTGKTSLCRSLAHKLAIRQQRRFPRASLLEIHSHSLFSKWFSTSGKLVSALFQMIRDMLEADPSSLVCVLIDEVESLASSRSNVSSGDPSDAVRAVNSLLTSLDRLRSFPNVLVIATTNLTGSVDAAFIDRVDLKIHIGCPGLSARYQILGSCVNELTRATIIHHDEVLPDFSRQLNSLEGDGERKSNGPKETTPSIHELLLKCATEAEGLSGRCLRKIPLQAYAQYLSETAGMESAGVSPMVFLKALHLAIEREQYARAQL
jgi:hypothetical protein